MILPDLPAGVYQHYKGPLYLALGYGHDANDEQRTVVIYIGLTLNEAHTGPRLAVRTASDFLAIVCSNENCTHYGWTIYGGNTCGYCQVRGCRRFAYIGPSWDGKVPV